MSSCPKNVHTVLGLAFLGPHQWIYFRTVDTNGGSACSKRKRLQWINEDRRKCGHCDVEEKAEYKVTTVNGVEAYYYTGNWIAAAARDGLEFWRDLQALDRASRRARREDMRLR